METPLISFAIPAYNRPELLAAALASIAAQREAVPYEVVICDDGPPALGAEDQARAFAGGRCRYFRNDPPLGAVQNWNRCLSEARGEWITVLHEDDLLYPCYLSLVLPHLTTALAAVAVQTDQGEMPPPLAEPSARSVSVWRYRPRYFLKSAMSPFPGVLVRAAVVRRLGGFSTAWGPLADYEFWYRVACAGPIAVVRARGAFYRVSPGQWTERAWTRMLRLSHLLRLQMVREQFQDSPRLGLWLARFFTYRNALSYSRRFGERPAALGRALSLRHIPGAWLPSGWVWQWLKLRS
jgi:glycosyltransferase involved in cell wall biosynthesis